MRIRPTLELFVTDHAMDRLQNRERFPVPPALPIDTEVRFMQFRNLVTKRIVWMCQIPGGFLVGERRTTRKRQMLVVLTALSKQMVRRSSHLRLSCHRVVVDKITYQHG
jgi:hypothetical protein